VRRPELQSLGALSNPHGTCVKPALDSLSALIRPHQIIRASSFCQSLLSLHMLPPVVSPSKLLLLVLPLAFSPLYCSSACFVALRSISLLSLVLFSSTFIFPRLVQIRLREPFSHPAFPRLIVCFQSTLRCLIISLTKRVIFSAVFEQPFQTNPLLGSPLLRVIRDYISLSISIVGTPCIHLLNSGVLCDSATRDCIGEDRSLKQPKFLQCPYGVLSPIRTCYASQ